MRGQCGVLPLVNLEKSSLLLILDLILRKISSEEQVGMASGQRKHQKILPGLALDRYHKISQTHTAATERMSLSGSAVLLSSV